MLYIIGVHKNIIFIGDLSKTYRRPIGDRHACSETHRRPTCLIGDPSDTDMPDRRPFGDRHARSETHWRPTCLIGDRPWARYVFLMGLR